jgi:integral membrane protein
MRLAHDARMDSLRALRWAALAEAVSYLVLGGAMVLKYGYGEAGAIRIPGMVHGVLFLLLSWLAIDACVQRGWPLGRVLVVMLASLLPIVPFFLDGKVRAWIASTPPPSPPAG